MISGPLVCDKNEVVFKNEVIGELPGSPGNLGYFGDLKKRGIGLNL